MFVNIQLLVFKKYLIYYCKVKAFVSYLTVRKATYSAICEENEQYNLGFLAGH